jgi:hypothetical protein
LEVRQKMLSIPAEKAIILVRPGPTESDQTASLIRLCEERGFDLVSQCHDARSCAALIQAGLATVVVAAHQVRREDLDDPVAGSSTCASPSIA